MSVQIVRFPQPPDQAWTLGTLFAGSFTFFTLELPWKENQHEISCIPPGRYNCLLAWSWDFKRLMPTLLGVPGRSDILIHIGNTTADTRGCILIGSEKGGGGTIIHSTDAFNKFFTWLGVELRNGPVPVEVSYAS